ncbi:UDP-galactopyranose mutase [Alteromonas aestuariivivens]|uniref:UDP-galactopyranose mutase n=1 Tax=Alteromonas aestuariivivens TaxID=1938339 RepID=A0A3D8M797_9ALTE|nr:UDP-galactopyranose mutase [Alteromonas aestuariivivens]RDV25052.1 UDP-galactopyranose mutase [Alteromonas aestuariivivens]
MINPDVIVIGAGFSGAVIAERFATVANKKVLVLEQREHIAGNCYDYKNEDGILVHRYGPHLFHTNKQHVWDYLSQFTDWHCYEHKVLSRVDNQLVPLPFNLNTLDCLYSVEDARKLKALLFENYGEGQKVPILTLKNSSEPLLRQLGQTVYDKFFVNYTVKQWGCAPEDISPEVTARVPVVISRDNRYFHDFFQAIPAQGYSELFKRMLAHSNIELVLNCDGTQRLSLNRDTGKIYFDGRRFDGQLVYTGMLDGLFSYTHGELPYRSLKFVYERHKKAFYQPATTVNYPNEEAFTRITEFKHILPAESDYTVIVKEYPQNFVRHDPERDIPYYPIFNQKNTKSHDIYQGLVRQFPNMTVLGRLADYKYYNMDDAVDNALKCFDRLNGAVDD